MSLVEMEPFRPPLPTGAPQPHHFPSVSLSLLENWLFFQCLSESWMDLGSSWCHTSTTPHKCDLQCLLLSQPLEALRGTSLVVVVLQFGMNPSTISFQDLWSTAQTPGLSNQFQLRLEWPWLTPSMRNIPAFATELHFVMSLSAFPNPVG